MHLSEITAFKTSSFQNLPSILQCTSMNAVNEDQAPQNNDGLALRTVAYSRNKCLYLDLFVRILLIYRGVSGHLGSCTLIFRPPTRCL
jgi:hypothetical protein